MAKEKKPRKRRPLTPDEKAAKAARERARYRAAREAGLTRDQARSIRKTIAKAPELIRQPGMMELTQLVGGLDRLLGKPKPKSKKRPSGRQKRVSGQKKDKKQSSSRSTPDFDNFVLRNPGVPGKELIRRYRASGGTIGNEKGLSRVREIRGLEKKQTRVTRIRYLSADERPLFGDADKRLIKDRYMYLMQFEVEVEGGSDTFTDYMYIASGAPLTLKELRDHVLDIWSDGVFYEKERYKAKTIVSNTIALVYAVDTKK